MGEDLHFRTYLKRRKDGGYINAHDVCEWNPADTVFGELFEGRDYDVFSLFGSPRGNYSTLPSARFGLPDFLVGSDLDLYCRECGYYGFVWFKVTELKSDLEDFIRRIRSPFDCMNEEKEGGHRFRFEYFLEEHHDLLNPGMKTARDMDEIERFYAEWYEEHGSIISKAKNMCWRVSNFIDRFTPQKDEPQREPSIYEVMYDMSETIHLFFFDS